jgi:hypothetical protein
MTETDPAQVQNIGQGRWFLSLVFGAVLSSSQQGGERLRNGGGPNRPRARVFLDGGRVADGLHDQEQDIWICGLAGQILTRLTFGPAQDVGTVWTPDGERIAFASVDLTEYNGYPQAIALRSLPCGLSVYYRQSVNFSSARIGRQFGRVGMEEWP